MLLRGFCLTSATALHCIVLDCIALHCIVLYCIAFVSAPLVLTSARRLTYPRLLLLGIVKNPVNPEDS